MAAPVLLLTRPAPDSRRFAGLLRARAGKLPQTIVSPLLEIVSVACPLPAGRITALIFTSARAVREAGDVEPGLTAYCVGDQTAQAAAKAGFRALSAGGAADDLVELILTRRPAGQLLHLRGEQSRGNIAERLTEAGLTVRTAVRYRQLARDLTQEARAALGGSQTVIAPVFSPDSAATLAAQGPFAAPLILCAISQAAADALGGLLSPGISVARRPTAAAMCELVLSALSAEGWPSGLA